MTSMIIEKGGKILLLKRAEDQSKGGLWNLPGGGVEENESYEEAIRREVKEETNLDISELKFFRSLVEINEDYIARPIFFYGKVDGNIKLDFENSDYGWFTKSGIAKMELIYNQKKVIIDYLNNRKQ